MRNGDPKFWLLQCTHNKMFSKSWVSKRLANRKHRTEQLKNMDYQPFHHLSRDVLFCLLDWIETLMETRKLPPNTLLWLSSTSKDLRTAAYSRIFTTISYTNTFATAKDMKRGALMVQTNLMMYEKTKYVMKIIGFKSVC